MPPNPPLGFRRVPRTFSDQDLLVEARRIELPNLLHAMQALYQLSYAPLGTPRLTEYPPTAARRSRVHPPPGPLIRQMTSTHRSTRILRYAGTCRDTRQTRFLGNVT
jgi:hypothetical protein